MKRKIVILTSIGVVSFTYIIGCFQTTNFVSQNSAKLANLFLYQENSPNYIIFSLKKLKYFFPVLINKPRNMETKFGTKTCIFPLGVAAGIDINGEYLKHLFRIGFGFVEIGSVTRHPQYTKQNVGYLSFLEKKLTFDNFYINQGYDNVLQNIRAYRNKKYKGIIGINIGIDATSTDPIQDYIDGVEIFSNYVDYITINIPDPKAPHICGLESPEWLTNLISKINSKLNESTLKPMFLLKLSPHLTKSECNIILSIINNPNTTIDGFIITNCKWKQKSNKQINDQYLRTKSNKMIKYFYERTNGKIIIGCGGVDCGVDAYNKLANGATLIQTYTSIIQNGLSTGVRINHELKIKMSSKGCKTVSEVIGYNLKTN